MQVSKARADLNNEYLKAIRAGDGLSPAEAYDDLNDASRAVIESVQRQHGEAWLVTIGRPVIVKAIFSGNDYNLYNFCANAVIPKHDDELEQMLREYNTTGKSFIINKVIDRIGDLGGVTLAWS